MLLWRMLCHRVPLARELSVEIYTERHIDDSNCQTARLALRFGTSVLRRYEAATCLNLSIRRMSCMQMKREVKSGPSMTVLMLSCSSSGSIMAPTC